MAHLPGTFTQQKDRQRSRSFVTGASLFDVSRNSYAPVRRGSLGIARLGRGSNCGRLTGVASNSRSASAIARSSCASTPAA